MTFRIISCIIDILNKITVDDSVDIAKKEISKVFSIKKEAIENDIDTGFYKDKIGICPICGKDVLKSKYGYGCIGYKDGCNFKINFTICNRIISKKNAELLLKTGKTSKIVGFTSKNGKSFDAYLKKSFLFHRPGEVPVSPHIAL